MATQASKTSAAPAAAPPTNITVNIQTPTNQKLLIARCSIDRSRLVGVRRPNGLYYLYTYDSDLDKMIPHACTCQAKVYEANLQPMYSAQSETLGCTVIFMFNSITQKTEQYVYRFETDHFEEVENTGLVYNSTQNSYYNVVAMLKGPNDEQVIIERDHTGGLRKLSWRGGAFKPMASSRVESLMMKLLAIQNETEDDDESSEYDSDESDLDSEYDEEDVAFDNYIKSIDSVMLSACTHQQVINAFNYNTYSYRGFFYNDTAGEFQHMECGCEAEIKVSERHLCPKYADFCTQDKMYVMHVFNIVTGVMEKYSLVGNGFKQVHYPELVYNPVKVSSSPVMLVSTHPTSTMVFLKDTNGRLSREVFCPVQLRYVTTTAEPVRTFILQKKEAEKRKEEERKIKKKERKEMALKKAAEEEKERQEQEALVQALTTETLQTAERIAKRSTERAAVFKKQMEQKLEKEEKEAAVNGPVEDKEKQRDTVDYLQSELNKMSCSPAPAAPNRPPARIPKVNLTSTISQTDISRQLPRPLSNSPTVPLSADRRRVLIQRFLTNDMDSSYPTATVPKTDMPNKY